MKSQKPKSGMQVSLIAVLCAGFLLQACVSSTLGTVKQSASLQPQSEQTNEPVNYDPVQRENAIAEMRQKASRSSGELTNAFVNPDGPNEPMSPEHKQRLLDEMNRQAAQSENVITDSELEARQRTIAEMQNRARNHYKKTLSSIEN